jgi:hypothetical protein
MKRSPSNWSLCVPLPAGPEKLGVRREDQSLFSLLLEIEIRLRKEARNNPRPQIEQRNKRSKVPDLW